MSSLLRERGIATLDELITILVMGKEPSLSQRVVEALLNNETYFFRDRSPFDLLAKTALPGARRTPPRREAHPHLVGGLLDRPGSSIRWRCCSPRIRLRWRGWTIDILGTDVSETAVDRARDGLYTQFEVQRGLGVTQMIRWFEESDDGWRVAEALRRNVRFQVHNILEAAAAPRPVRHRPVPQRPALPQRRQEARWRSTAWRRRWRPTAG